MWCTHHRTCLADACASPSEPREPSAAEAVDYTGEGPCKLWHRLRDAAEATRRRCVAAEGEEPDPQSTQHGPSLDRGLADAPAGAVAATLRHAHLQWLATLGTYAATTLEWLRAHAPDAMHAAVVRVHWVGASIGEVEGLCAVEALLLHALPHCEVWRITDALRNISFSGILLGSTGLEMLRNYA